MSEAKEATKPEPAPAPKLTEKQSTQALRNHVREVQILLAKGSKSDIDQIGERLQEILDWLDAVLDEKRPNPSSVGGH